MSQASAQVASAVSLGMQRLGHLAVEFRCRCPELIRVERGLLAQSDALAKNMGVTRAGLIERGLKAVLAAGGKL